MNLTNLELEDIGRLFIEIHLIELPIQQLYFIFPHFPLFIFLSSLWLYFIIVYLAIIYSFHYSFLFPPLFFLAFSFLFSPLSSTSLNFHGLTSASHVSYEEDYKQGLRKREMDKNQIANIGGCSVLNVLIRCSS